jgi:hypothetical protein
VAGASALRDAAREHNMLDPKEQAKGGFRAQAERLREREEQPATTASADGAASAPSGAPDGTSAQPEAQADGAHVVGPPQTAEPPTPPGTRQPKRWH